MALNDIERRLERGVEGFFGRVFRSAVRPVELGRKLTREMDSKRTVGVDGSTLVPNVFQFEVSDDDYAQLADMLGALRRELVDLAREHAREQGYRLAGPVEVELEASTSRRPGLVTVEGHFQAPESGGAIASLVLPDGSRVPLTDDVVTIGRQSGCTVVLGDPNASRHHAEVRPTGTGFVLIDLGSTNGTSVNGMPITEHLLVSGDVIAFGSTVFRFEQD